MSTLCQSLIDQMAEEVGVFWAYNLYEQCPHGIATKFDKHGMNEALRCRRNWGTAFSGYQGNESGLSSPCLGSAMEEWLNLTATLDAIHAPSTSVFWNLDNGHGFNYTSDQAFVGPIYEKALKANLKVLVYEGDIDACGLQTSDVEDVFVPLFDSIMNRTQKWRPWTGDGYQELGGYVIEWDDRQAQFVSVRGSGHLVPLNRPKMSSVMINAFTQGHKLPKLNSNPLQQKELIQTEAEL